MNSFLPLFKKEMREFLRTYKLLIVPIATILVMVMHPISLKLLPILLESELPEGMVIEVPEMLIPEVLANVFANFESLGIIIFILIAMSAIAGEREKSIAPMILVKPATRGAYVFSKWLAYSLLVSISYIIGMIVTVYYTYFLFEGKIIWSDVIIGTLLYIPIILMTISLTILYSTFVKTSFIVGVLAFASYLLLMKVPQYIHDSLVSYTPSYLVQNANQMIAGAESEVFTPLVSTVCIMLILLVVGLQTFKRQEI